MDKVATLRHVILNAIKSNPESGIGYVPVNGDTVRQTYGQLYEAALQLWGRLQKAGVKRGDKVIAQLATSRAQIEMFWACVLGGAIPVLLPQVTGWSRESENKRKLVAVWGSLNKPLLVIDGQHVSAFSQLAQSGVLPGCRVLEFDADSKVDYSPGLPEAVDCAEDDLAFLQFSSGSTGMPKGVRLTHRNLVCNIRDIAQTARMGQADTFLSWMPYFHDMGLIGMHLVPLYLGINQIKMEASHFVTNPLRWLQEIDRNRATMIGCPNFGLELVLEKVTAADVQALDLSCVRLLFNGAEPISTRTMRAFCAHLKPAAFDERAMYPVYGLAEASLAVTFGVPGELPRVHQIDKRALSEQGAMQAIDAAGEVVEYADVGTTLPSIQLRICNTDGTECGDRTVGEIQIRGENVTSGYECNEEANSTTFTEDGWLRTGDLGCLCDGRLIVVGRLKEVIIVNGRNVMAYDIERVAREMAGLKAGAVAACGIIDPSTSKQRVAVFIATRKKTDLWAWLSDIRTSLEEYFGFPIDYVIPVANIPKTSSGKLQRVKLAEELRRGAYRDQIEAFEDFRSLIHANRLHVQPASELERTIHGIWTDVLSLPTAQVGIDDSFARLGGTSVKAMQVLSRIEAACEREYGFDLLMECKTIREMAVYIERQGTDELVRSAVEQKNALVPEAPARKIAIIGFALRFPGARNADEFWNNIINARSAVAPVPSQRWVDDCSTHHMGALDDIDLFDANFFGISDAEATVIDPQQRIALEVAYEALEDAGYAGTRLGSQRKVGVFLGASTNGYLDQVNACLSSEHADAARKPFTMAGNLLNMIAARISHCLNLKGPALTLDTACSSSIVALEVACKELLSNSCEMALAGGINLLLGPTAHRLFEVAGALSSDGKCRAFDEMANGMVPGEGVGIVILKELDKAIRDGDRVEAVIEAVHINNDGRSIGIMAPNPQGQEELLRAAYQIAGISPERISYVEAHGTGTPIGDPIEVRSLNRVFPTLPDKGKYCVLGSVKPNIGHLLAAAGIAGTIKVLLAMRHEKLPPTLHFQNAHPQIGLDKTPFQITSESIDWEHQGETRYAAVSSFGFGGTNAHLVLSEPPVVTPPRTSRHTEAHLLCLSARTAEELIQSSTRLAHYLASNPDVDLRNVCYTHNLGRQHFTHRRHVVAQSASKVALLLQQPASHAAPAASGQVQPAFLFSGQGSQYRGMGKSLYLRFPQFRKYIDHCCSIADPLLPEGRDLRSIIFDEQGRDLLADTLYAQPAIFVIEYAIARFWMDLGIKPSVLIGHSLGELVAACVAGVFPIESGIKLVIARAQHMSRSEPGFMLAVLADEGRISRLIETHRLKVDIAAINAPDQCVLSGPAAILDAVQSALAIERIATVPLAASKGFHSSLMDPVITDFAPDLAGIDFHPPKIPVISNINGELAGNEIATPEYWLAHLRKPVRFAACVERLLSMGTSCLLEIGPGNQLGNLVRGQFEEKNDCVVLYSLPPKGSSRSSDEFLLETAGTLWECGAMIALDRLPGMESARIVSLPTYPFNRKPHWLPHSASSAAMSMQNQHLLTNNTELRHHAPDWFYRPNWRERMLTPRVPASAEGRKWIVFDNGSDLAERIVAALNTRGVKCIRVFTGNVFAANQSALRVEINPAEQEHYVRLLNEAVADGQTINGICYLWTAHVPLPAESISKRVERELSAGVSSLFRLAKALSVSKEDRQLTLAAITCNVQSVAGYDTALFPTGGAVSGLLKSVAFEVRGVDVTCIDVDAAAEDAHQTAECIADELDATQRDGNFIAYRKEKRFAEQVLRIPVGQVAPRNPMLVENGVYLITGGLGGIGLELADFLARRYRAHLVLVARTYLPDETEWDTYLAEHPDDDRVVKAIRRLRRLQEYAASVLVVSADTASMDDMARVELCIAGKFGYLDGVIHCAGILRDRLISQMTEAEWSEVLRPKMLGTATLYERTRSLKPSAFILFSSLAGVTGNVGQANHAAANSFEDAFARFAEQCGQRTLVVNWGFWRETGVVSDAFYERILARQGVYPMTTELALAAFERATTLPFLQQIIANVTEGFFSSSSENSEMADVLRSAISVPVAANFRHQLDAYAAAHSRINALSAQLILQSLVHTAGISKDSAPVILDELANAVNALPQYRPLLHRYLEILREDNLLVRNGDGYIVPSSVAFTDVEQEAQSLAKEFPFLSTPIAVLTRCMHALPQILSGARHAVATLFARGSLDDLEEIYEKLPMLRLGNLMLASALTACMERIGGRTTEILEIGAGTGGLSSEVIPRVGAAGPVSYLYTDVSQMFLTHAKTKFGTYEFVKTEVLDVCKDLDGQSFKGRQFDVVIAANVLHATADLRKSLGNIKTLLRPGGYLMTVETTRPSRFADCTVGLLDGWWSFTDHDIRAGYPLLDKHQWKSLLGELGFETRALPIKGRESDAESDFSLIVARLPESLASASRQSSALECSRAGMDHVRMAAHGTGVPVEKSNPETSHGHVECTVMTVLSEALGLNGIGLHTNFFDLGTHSLRATQIVSSLREIFGVEIPLVSLFDKPTIAQLSDLIREHGAAKGIEADVIAEVFNEVHQLSDRDVATMVAGEQDSVPANN